MNTERIVCIVGPTAAGKTALALRVAARWPIEVVSADSRQVYRGLDIGTGKPSAAERARVPHHGLDLVDPAGEFDAGQFSAMAQRAIADAHRRGCGVLVVGGTGLYIRALRRGLSPTPPRVPRLRQVLADLARQDGAPALHRWLTVIDPPLAARVHPNDSARIVRGLEIALATGRRLSAWQDVAGQVPPWDVLLIGLSAAVPSLDARIASRAEGMLAAGWLDEVERLRQTMPRDAPAWRTVGYRELRAVLEGTTTLREGLMATIQATRQFAKRQRTWFRREPDVQWRDIEDDLDPVVDEIGAFLGGAAARSSP